MFNFNNKSNNLNCFTNLGGENSIYNKRNFYQNQNKGDQINNQSLNIIHDENKNSRNYELNNFNRSNTNFSQDKYNRSYNRLGKKLILFSFNLT